MKLTQNAFQHNKYAFGILDGIMYVKASILKQLDINIPLL